MESAVLRELFYLALSPHIHYVCACVCVRVCLCVFTNLVEDAGSVVCRCMRCVRRRKCSLMERCTSAGMSGEVWLIFTAASRKPMEPMGPFTFSVAMVTSGCWGLGRLWCWRGQLSRPQAGLRAAELEDRALFRQGTQHSFQEAKAQRPRRARPQSRNRKRSRQNVKPG